MTCTRSEFNSLKTAVALAQVCDKHMPSTLSEEQKRNLAAAESALVGCTITDADSIHPLDIANEFARAAGVPQI